MIGDLGRPPPLLCADWGRLRWRGSARDIYTALNFTSPTALHGWVIPTATDIGFAVPVLAAVGTFTPLGDACLPADLAGGR